MSKDIKPGDLVMIVRGMPCCGFLGHFRYGSIFLVKDIRKVDDFVCRGCSKSLGTVIGASDFNLGGLLSMLIKIDPPSTEDSLPTRKEIKELV